MHARLMLKHSCYWATMQSGLDDNSPLYYRSDVGEWYTQCTRVLRSYFLAWTESTSANCRNYLVIYGIPGGIHSTDYIHCDGTQLELADTNLGSEQPFSRSSHYQWSAGSYGQLLFILPTRVSLITLTLHYYSDSDRGLSRLIFYAVPDDFDIWDTPTTSHTHLNVAAVPPGGEPAGNRSVSINVNFNTMKVLMYKYSSSFHFAVSEVEFFTCNRLSRKILVIYIQCMLCY